MQDLEEGKTIDGNPIDLEDTICRPIAGPSAEPEAARSISGGEFLRSVEQLYDTEEKTGDKVEENLASLVNSKFTVKQPQKSLQQRIDYLPRPDNCPSLVVPRVNRLIWHSEK